MTDPDSSATHEIALRDPRAPFLRRWIAWSIDIVLAGLAVLVANRLIPAAAHEESPLLGGLVAFFLAALYFWVPEALWGATLGKLAAGVRVVDAAGRPPGFRKSLIRTLLRFLEANPFLFGAVPAAIVAFRSKTGGRLGDILARTYVLRVSDLRGRALQPNEDS